MCWLIDLVSFSICHSFIKKKRLILERISSLNLDNAMNLLTCKTNFFKRLQKWNWYHWTCFIGLWKKCKPYLTILTLSVSIRFTSVYQLLEKFYASISYENKNVEGAHCSCNKSLYLKYEMFEYYMSEWVYILHKIKI